MSRPELGSKCICAGCSERFYDLNKTPPICPKCGAEQPPPKPKVFKPSRGTLENRRFTQPMDVPAADDGGTPEGIADAEDEEEDLVDADDDAADDIGVAPDRDKTPE